MQTTVHEVELRGGVRLTVEEAGRGPALLLMHAGVSERHMWDPQWEDLAADHRVVRWDWRGFGDTPHVSGPFSYSEDVLRVMDALDITRGTLVGCSFAGFVAIKVAAEHPERVARLVLVGSGLPGYEAKNPPEVERLFAEEEAAFAREDVDRALAVLEQLWLVGPARRAEDVDPTYLQQARELLRRADRPDNGAVSEDSSWSGEGAFESLKMPVLAMVGDQDVPDAVASAHEMARRLPGLTLRVVAGAAHLPNMERPAEFGAVLREWLATTGEDVRDE